jgi:hypothetical protein
MLIQALSAKEEESSMEGLECTVTLQEIIVARTQTVKVSKRMQTTGETEGGVTTVTPIKNQSLLRDGVDFINWLSGGGSQ